MAMGIRVITNRGPGNVVTERRPMRFLSLDGGGMRGLYTAAVLNELCCRFAPQHTVGARFDLGKQFDGIVGVSTGSIIAAGLALGLAPLDMVRFYRDWGPRIFSNPIPNFESMSGI